MTRPMRGRACAPLALLLAAAPAAAATLTTTPFDATADGKPVSLTTMTSAHGVTVKFISYGAIVTEAIAPDCRGHPANLVVGFPTLHDYETKGAEGGFYFGALVGRYANRIAGGHFSLDGHDYTLPVNNTPNALHGGLKGFGKLETQHRPDSPNHPDFPTTEPKPEQSPDSTTIFRLSLRP